MQGQAVLWENDMTAALVPQEEPGEWTFLATLQCPVCKKWSLQMEQTVANRERGYLTRYVCLTASCTRPLELYDMRMGLDYAKK